ncbi:zinc knuckle [Ostertagia ostertagi]
MDASNSERLKSDYIRLRSAIGVLPEPERLHRQIVSDCRAIASLRRSLTTLSHSVRNLCNSALSHTEFFHRHQYLKLTLEKLELRFVLTRSHLRDSWSYPPLMFATGILQPFEWERLWETTLAQEDLVVDAAELEELISDALNTIGEDLTLLDDLHEEITTTSFREDTHFRHEVLKHLREISRKLDKNDADQTAEFPGGEDAKDAENERMELVDIREEDEKMDTASHVNELETINRNADFMEAVGDPDEDEEPLVLLEAISDDELEDQNDTDRDGELQVMVQFDRREDPDDEISRLRQQLGDAEQAAGEYDRMIAELERKKRGRPRRYEGQIENPNDARMRCIFCNIRGDHYSDSCTVYSTLKARTLRINQTKICKKCLDRYCPKGENCKKHHATCYHCGDSGHNSAFCPLPEENQRTEDQISYLRRKRDEARELIRRISSGLTRRGIDA